MVQQKNKSKTVILAGDIGGTNTRLALFVDRDGRLEPVAEARYPSRNYSSLEEIVAEFVGKNNVPLVWAGFGVAGPVQNGRSQTTNLPWVVEARQLAERFGIAAVALVNDLEANAYGIATLETSDFAVIQSGTPDAVGNAAIISPGTGLGEAGLYWDGNQHHPFACEGGHASFAPADELQEKLLGYLRLQFKHVSWERVLSGPGLLNIYQFLRDTGHGPEPAWLAEEIRQGDPSEVISRMALARRSELCEKALELFVSLFAAEAGNLALKLMGRGGVYLGGGIAPKIIKMLKSPAFREAFAAKGRMRPLLEAMPILVILNEKTALRGAARCALLQGVKGRCD